MCVHTYIHFMHGQWLFQGPTEAGGYCHICRSSTINGDHAVKCSLLLAITKAITGQHSQTKSLMNL